MRKLFGLLIVLALVLAVSAVCGEAGTDRITGSIADGAYVLTVNTDPDDAGEWQADEMAQDDTVVKLAYSGLENGVFTARYEPAGDGEICVNLRHFNAHACCDEMYSFILLVKDGKVQEATGGSRTASPDEEELDPYFSGEWLEKDTQFTALNVMKNAGDGWNVEIVSPMSHGAWMIRASAYYDCDYDGFIYTDGIKYDLIPDGEPKEAATGVSGILRFTEDGDNVLMTWSDWESGSEETVFGRAPGMPADGRT